MKKILGLTFTILLLSKAYSQGDSLSFSGYFDFFYSYDFAEPLNNQRQYTTQAARHNELNLNLAILRGNYSSENFRANLALQTGSYPVTNYAEPTALAQLIHEANVGIKLGEGSWIDVGVLPSHFGYESTLTYDNENYTQALVTEYTPYYQTGIQFSQKINEDVSVSAVLLNGWQNIYETNDAKAIGASVDFSATDELSFSYGNFFGDEPFQGGDDAFRMHHNIYGHYEMDEFTFTGIIDITFQNPDNLTSNPASFITLISSYRFRKDWIVGGRLERVVDTNGILIAQDFQTNSLTGTLTHFLLPNVAARAEARLYFGDEPVWAVLDGSQYNNQVLSIAITAKIE